MAGARDRGRKKARGAASAEQEGKSSAASEDEIVLEGESDRRRQVLEDEAIVEGADSHNLLASERQRRTRGNSSTRSLSSKKSSRAGSLKLDCPEQREQEPGTPDSMASYNSLASLSTLGEFAPPWTSVSFSCGGWLQFYLFGVARAFQALGLDKNIKLAGCSGGALAAAGLAFEGDFDAAIEFCKESCVPRAHGKVSGLFNLSQYVAECTDKLIAPIFRVLPPGQLQVAITTFPYLETIRVMEHPTVGDLKDSLLCSAAAYPAASLHKHRRFGLCIDGGISDFQPIIDSDTITVSPFYFSDCDIRPSRYVPPWWAFIPPANTDTVDWIYNLGWNDALEYVNSRGIKWEPGSGSPRAKEKWPHLDESYLLQKRRQEGREAEIGSHPYDTPRKITMHRFLGYNYSSLAANVINFCLDLGLLLVFLIFLKPLALALIYVELFLRVLLGVLGILGSHVMMLLSLPLVLMLSLPYQLGKGLGFDKPREVRGFEKWARAWGDKDKARIRVTFLGDKMSCLFSLSLVLRFLPGSFNKPSDRNLRKHDKLYMHSMLYRILRHII